MKRRALIVCADHPKNKSPLVSPQKDAELIHTFLRSCLGGAWNADEIRVIRNPTKREFAALRNEFQNGSDYTLTFFSGYASASKRGRVLYLHFADGRIKQDVLFAQAPRQTWIMDVNKSVPRFPDAGLLNPHKWKLHQRTNRKTAREIYDKAILAGNEGINLMLSECTLGNNGVETEQGSGYVIALLKQAEIFSQKKGRSPSLNTRKAHDGAKKYLESVLGSEQIPVVLRNKVYFPWAVRGGARCQRVDVRG